LDIRLTIRSPGQAIVGSASFCNIALGYGILALTAENQLASTELDFRSVDRLSSSLLGSKTLDVPADPTADSRSLLSKPLDITALINSITSPSDYDPRGPLRSRSDSRKPLNEINASQLKLLGDITSQIRRRTKAIRAASQTIENRLDLQVKEYQRQLKLLKSTRSDMKEVASREDSSDRIERITKHQRSLADRLDKVVTVAMANHKGPDLSESERKYLKELDQSRRHIGDLLQKFETVSHPVLHSQFA
jgi:nucleoporin NUP82